MNSSAKRWSVILSLTAVFLLSNAAMGQVSTMSEVQKLQLKVNALSTLNSAIGNVDRKAGLRESYLDDYFKANRLRAEYRESLTGNAHKSVIEQADADMEAELEDPDAEEPVSDTTDPMDLADQASDLAADTTTDALADAAAEALADATDTAEDTAEVASGPAIEVDSDGNPVPKAANWGKDESTDRDVPLTYEDALELVIHYELENNLDAAMNTTQDKASLQASYDAWEKIAKGKFPKTITRIMEVERKVKFLKDTERWDAFMDWAEGEADVRDEAAAVAKEEQLAKNQANLDEAARNRAELAETRRQDAAERERLRDERLEKKWNRQAEAYRLQSERIQAEAGPEQYYYPDNGRWWR